MFKRRGTIIAEGLKIIGSVSAAGLVEVNGQIEAMCTARRYSFLRRPPSMEMLKLTVLW
jgi:hypothetical protein